MLDLMRLYLRKKSNLPQRKNILLTKPLLGASPNKSVVSRPKHVITKKNVLANQDVVLLATSKANVIKVEVTA